MNAIIRKGVLVLTETIGKIRHEGSGFDGFNVGFNDLSKLLGHRSSCLAQWKGFGGIKVKEYTGEYHTHDHEHFMFSIDTSRIFLGFEWKSEYAGCEMDMRQISDAASLLEVDKKKRV